tara:strand:+ start:59 stop:667 length:609 start_codon:yes stop_codon:yes gene_type:complete
MSIFKSLFSSNKSEKNFGIELFRALYEPNKQKVIDLMKNYKIGINNYTDFSNSNSILINAVNCSSEFQDSKEQIELIEYLIDLNADVNWKNEKGFNALHIALAYHDLSKTALLLIKKGKPDVNIVEDEHGNSPIFTAIREYGLTWRDEQKEVNQLRFEIIKELLSRGANLDKINKHGISARKWLERIPENDKLHQLLKEFKK